MGSLLRFIFRSPLRAAIVCGLLVALVFGLASFPQPELTKSVSDWQITDVITDAEQQQLLVARDAARNGERELVELTEEEFRDRGLAYSYGLPGIEGSGRRFVIQYFGVDDLASGPVYVSERQIFAAPWWSPHRFIYKAAYAEVSAFQDVIELTFERDVVGLTGLIVLDAFVGAVYGLVIGLIVSALRGAGLMPSPKSGDAIRHRAVTRA